MALTATISYSFPLLFFLLLIPCLQAPEGETHQSAEQWHGQPQPVRIGRIDERIQHAGRWWRRQLDADSGHSDEHGGHAGFDCFYNSAIVADGTGLVAAVSRPTHSTQRAAVAGDDGPFLRPHGRVSADVAGVVPSAAVSDVQSAHGLRHDAHHSHGIVATRATLPVIRT